MWVPCLVAGEDGTLASQAEGGWCCLLVDVVAMATAVAWPGVLDVWEPLEEEEEE